MRVAIDRQCSFCDRAYAPGVRLVAGPIAHICDECVLLSLSVLVQQGLPLKQLATALLYASESQPPHPALPAKTSRALLASALALGDDDADITAQIGRALASLPANESRE